MNDDFSAEFDALREDLSTEGENEEEKIRRMAEEAKAAKASAPPAEAPAPQAAAPEAAQPAPQAPAAAPEGVAGGEGNEGIGGMLMGAADWVKENTGVDLAQTAMDMVMPQMAGARKIADAATQVIGEDNPLSRVSQLAADGARMIPGAGAGVVESVGSAAEILGDTAKSIPGLLNQNWKPDAKDDIFQFGPDSKYEWAKWDLGKDEIGAQTAVGKITQGFLEMGALMAATGGFAGAAKGAGVVKSGLIGGRSGIAADMIMASNGEGGLSNVIRENAPEWYPKWMTMLAVDNDDSPLEVMGKVAAEGFFLGFAADAAGAYVVATRAVKKYLKEHPKATPAELDAVAANNYAKAQEIAVKAQNGGVTPDVAIKTMRDTVAERPPSRVQFNEEGGANKVIDLGDGKQVEVDYFRSSVGVVGINWEAKDLAGQGRRVLREITDDIASMEPGTVVRNEPAKDGYGTGRSGAQKNKLHQYQEARKELGYQKAREIINAKAPEVTPEDQIQLNETAENLGWKPTPEQPDATPWDIISDRQKDYLASDWLNKREKEVIATIGDRPNTRADLYKKIGFGDVDSNGMQYGVVREARNGNKVLDPINGSDAVVAAIRAKQNRGRPLYHATTKAAGEAIRQGGFKGGSEGTNILGSGIYTAPDAGYAKSYGEELLEIDTKGLNIREMDRPMQQFMDENGIEYKYYDLSTGDDIDINNTNLTPEDIGLDIDPAGKKKLRELLSEGGKYQGVTYDPIFQQNLRGAGEETFLFDPSSVRLKQPDAPIPGLDQYQGYRKLLETAGRRLAGTGDSILKENFMRLYEQAAYGIPVSIDDVKLLFPEKFTPGTRVITEPTIVGLDGALNSLPQTGGFTINPLTGETPTTGFMVAIDGIDLKQFDEESITNFMADNYDLLSREDVFVGGYISQTTGKPVVELSRLVDNSDEAFLLGNLFDQEMIFDNIRGVEIPIGGADELKRTAGLHERSQTAREPLGPGPADPVEAQASAVQNLNYRAPNKVQEVMTQPKFEMIAEGTDDYTRKLLQDMLNDGTIPLNNLSKVVGKPVDVIAKEAREYIQMVTGGSGKIDFDKINNSMTAKDQYGKPILGDAQLVAVIQMMKDTSQQLAKSAKSIADKFDSGMDVAEDFSRLVVQQKALMKIHKETVSYQGRSLWNNKIRLDDIDVDNPLPDVDVQKLQRQYDKATKKLDRIEEAVRSGDPKAKQEAYQLALQLRLADGNPEDFVGINKSIGNGITEQLLGNMYNSLLSGPETHLVNTLSSLFMTFYRPLNLMVGSGFKKNKEAFAAFHGINQTLSDAWRLSTDAYTKAKSGQVANAKSGQKLTSGLEQLRIHQEYAETSSNPFVKMAVGFEGLLYDLKNNPYLAWSGPLMEAEDAFSSAISARFEFNMNMMHRAIDEADDGSVESVFKSLLNQEKKRYFTESGEILDPSLQQVADESTFRHKLEGRAESFAGFVNQNPWIRPFFPFVKTGHNIMVFTAESTPLTVFTKEWQDVMAGSDESAKAILKGRAATGSFIMLSAAMMAGAGLITGAGPATGPERDAWERNHKPRSIKIGDTWVSYERMEPFSSVIQAAADITYGIKRGLIDENKAQFLASYMTYAFAQNFTDKSVFSGLDPLSKLLNPGFNPSGTITVPVDLANNVLPLASLRRMLANAMEPHKQYYDQQWQRAVDQATIGLIPGLGNTQYDWLDGSPITGGNQGLINAISPLNVHKRGSDIVRDTLESLGYDSQTILKTVENENLSAAERSELGKLMGSGALYDELERKIKRRGYDEFAKELRAARARDTDLTGLLEKGGNLGRDRDQSVYIEINEIVMKHRDMALQAIRSKNARLNTEIGKKQRRKSKARTRTAEDLRNFHKN